MKKDLRYLQSLIALNLLPLIPWLRTPYVIYTLWAVSVAAMAIHLTYYILRAIKAHTVFAADRTPENRLSVQHFIYKFIIMLFACIISCWMVYVGFKYTGVV